jgi:hypothetical protein
VSVMMGLSCDARPGCFLIARIILLSCDRRRDALGHGEGTLTKAAMGDQPHSQRFPHHCCRR